MNEIRGLAILLLLQAVGEGVARLGHLPIPGPVIGLVLLLAGLRWAWLREPVSAAAELLLTHLSLLFVPVGVGVITHLDLVARHGALLLGVIVVSTWVGMAITALALQALMRAGGEPEASPGARATPGRPGAQGDGHG